VASVTAVFALLPLLGAPSLPPIGTAGLPTVSIPSAPGVGTPSVPSVPLPAAGVGLPYGEATACNRYAAPSGSDRARGGPRTPFRTVQRLVNSLRPGETGCLRAGTYRTPVRIARGGRRRARITLAAYPGETATILGRFKIMKGANYVSVTGLRLNGANPTRLPSPMVYANHATFSYDDVTNDHTGICFEVGNATWGWATDTVISHDRIHDCGQVPDDNLQHGLYIEAATDTTIEWSLIYDNAARGIQLYPDAQHTTIDHNIIDGNGEGILISGEGGHASSYTNIYDNILSDATVRHDVESYWPVGNPVGRGNTIHNNCLWRGREGAIGASAGGLRASDNARVNPMFVNAAAHDYRLEAASPCLFAVGDVDAAVDGLAATIPLIKRSPFAGRVSGSRSPSTKKIVLAG
jgi:Right handed beta helix region